jgi:hypothetical protein
VRGKKEKEKINKKKKLRNTESLPLHESKFLALDSLCEQKKKKKEKKQIKEKRQKKESLPLQSPPVAKLLSVDSCEEKK